MASRQLITKSLAQRTSPSSPAIASTWSPPAKRRIGLTMRKPFLRSLESSNPAEHSPISVLSQVFLLKPGYGNFSIVGRPDLRPLLQKYVYGGPGTLGPYWEEPGRSIVVSLYRDIVPPSALYQDVTRLFFPRKSSTGENEAIVQISGKMTISIMEPYARTWSSYHGWQTAFPERKSRANGGEGDIIDEMFDELKRETGWDDDTEFDVEWSSSILLARKRDD